MHQTAVLSKIFAAKYLLVSVNEDHKITRNNTRFEILWNLNASGNRGFKNKQKQKVGSYNQLKKTFKAFHILTEPAYQCNEVFSSPSMAMSGQQAGERSDLILPISSWSPCRGRTHFRISLTQSLGTMLA